MRTILIGTFQHKSSATFWNVVSSKAPLHGNPIVCWKFLHVLHKLMREGHHNVLVESLKHRYVKGGSTWPNPELTSLTCN